MLRSRRFALVAVVAVLGLSACGDPGDTTSPADSPAVIVLGAGKSGPTSAEGAPVNGGVADRSMMIGNITYLFDGSYPDLGDTGPSWTLPAGQVDAAAVARIAKVLGVAGEPRALPAEQGGGWMVGPADYSAATVTVSGDGMVSWWYSPSPTVSTTPVEGCAYPDKGATVPGTTAGSGGGSDAAGEADAPVAPPDAVTIGTDVVSPPMEPCAAPTPPAGVPTKAEAEAKATQLMKDLGLDPAAYELTSYADEWSANVTAWLLVGGHRSPLQLNVGFGAEGALQWASGTLAVPQASSDYPLVTPEEALARLNDPNGMWGGYYGGIYGGVGIGGMARDAVAPAGAAEGAPVATVGVAPNDTAVSGGGTSGSGGASVAPVPPESMPPDSVLVDPMPTYVPEDITIHLSSVRLDLTMVWAQDGTVWLLPAYTFTSTDGGEYTVIAVEDQYLQQANASTVDTTIPTDTVVVDTTTPAATNPVDSVPVDTAVVDTTIASDPTSGESQALIGLTVDEAVKVAADHGWTVRVVVLDGEPQIVTDDYSPDRVNVGVTDGVVTSVESRG